jgi:hypothetical protein
LAKHAADGCDGDLLEAVTSGRRQCHAQVCHAVCVVAIADEVDPDLDGVGAEHLIKYRDVGQDARPHRSVH